MSILEEEAKEKTIGRVVFIHANNESAAITLQQEFQEKHPEIESMVSYFGPVLGTHLGEGAIGVTWYTV